MPFKQLDSGFAILDVKRGRSRLVRRCRAEDVHIPVTIHGFITRQWSGDDGVSVEFEVEVTSAMEG